MNTDGWKVVDDKVYVYVWPEPADEIPLPTTHDRLQSIKFEPEEVMMRTAATIRSWGRNLQGNVSSRPFFGRGGWANPLDSSSYAPDGTAALLLASWATCCNAGHKSKLHAQNKYGAATGCLHQNNQQTNKIRNCMCFCGCRELKFWNEICGKLLLSQ